MIFKARKHNNHLYNILLTLSRNIFFYKKIELLDTFQTRVFLMFFHFAILMIISREKGEKFDQDQYDSLFYNIENNLRELGHGDVSVNKKMKDLNKILYDILLKIQLNTKNQNVKDSNKKIYIKFFEELKVQKNPKFVEFDNYFHSFYNYCSKLPLDNMLKQVINFKY